MENSVLIAFITIVQLLGIIYAYNFFMSQKTIQKIKEAEAKAGEAKVKALEAEANAHEAEAKAKATQPKKPTKEELKEAVKMGRKEVDKIIKY